MWGSGEVPRRLGIVCVAECVKICEQPVVRKEAKREVYRRYFRNKPMDTEKFRRRIFRGKRLQNNKTVCIMAIRIYGKGGCYGKGCYHCV